MRQLQALAIMMSGNNVFLTGSPGAGKTYVLNKFIERAQNAGKVVAVTASTGIAATHLNGTTIHSWSGLGIRDFLGPDDERWLKENDRLIKRYNSVDILVIDEISMLHGSRLNMVNAVAKLLRENPAPFGGMQVVLVGDLFQLPPVSRGNEDVDFMHASAAWKELDPTVCYITEQHRQSEQDGLLALLEAMRAGEIDEMHQELLEHRMGVTPPVDVAITRLYAHNVDVESINNSHLAAIARDGKTYTMLTKGSKPRIEQLVKSVLAPEELHLKVEAEVMFVANDFGAGFVNGTRGRVVDFRGDTPVVRLSSGRDIEVEAHTWSFTEDGRVRAEVSQLPLRLAWAITIHKSQGMSLDAAEVDLSRAFTPGMGYVALSRVRSMEGLYLKGINRMALQMHPTIYEFDQMLRSASEQAGLAVEDIQDEPKARAPRAIATYDSVLLDRLKQWRYARAQSDQVAPYMIAHNTTLTALATKPCLTAAELLRVPGLGPKKIEQYGHEIVAITTSHLMRNSAL